MQTAKLIVFVNIFPEWVRKRIGLQAILATTTLVFGSIWSDGACAQQTSGSQTSSTTVEQFQLWTQFSAIRNITPGMRGFIEIGPRFRTQQPNQPRAQPSNFQFDRLVTGLWLVFPFNASNTLRVGVRTFLNTATEARRFDDTETRFSQDHLGAYPIGDVVFSTRIRLEERLLPNRQSPSIRFRTRLGFEFPLNEVRSWWYILNGELLFNINNAGVPNLRPGLSENRVTTGFRTRLSPGINLEILYQYSGSWLSREAAFEDFRHSLLLNIAFDIDQIEQANAQRVDRKKLAMSPVQLPSASSDLPLVEPAKPPNVAALIDKATLLHQVSLSAIDLNAPEEFSAETQASSLLDGRVASFLPVGNVFMAQTTPEKQIELPEVPVVASREKNRKADLQTSLLMNSLDGEGADGAP